MKKLIIIILLLSSISAFSQTTPRWLVGYNVLTGMPTTYRDTLRTYFYKSPLYTIGDSIYWDSSHYYLFKNTGRTVASVLTSNYGVGTDTARGKFEVAVNGIGSPTIIDDSLSFVLANNASSTGSAAILQQAAPAIRFRMHGWYPSTSRDTLFDFKIQPYISTWNSGGILFQSRPGGNGSYGTNFTFSNAGNFTATNAINSSTVVASSTVSGAALIANVGGMSTTSTYGILSNSASNSTINIPVRGSPYIGWNAAAWDTLAGASRAVLFGSEVRPISLSSNISGSWNLWYGFNGGTHSDLLSVKSNGAFIFPFTNTSTGTTGAQTINKISGTVNVAAAGTTVTVTNSLVAITSTVFAVIRTNDATARIANVVPAAGSFTINLTAATTAETSIGFWVIN